MPLMNFEGLDRLVSVMEVGSEYEAHGHRAIYDHISAKVENDSAFADGEPHPSVIFYAIRNILRPSFIFGQIPDLLDLLAMVDTFRRHAVNVSSVALSWQEYYSKEPSPDMRLLTKHELKRIERYVAKGEDDRLLYILLIKNLCLLHVYYLVTAPESITLARHLNDYFPGCFSNNDRPSRVLFHSGLSDGEKRMMEEAYQECKEWLIEVDRWQEEREELLATSTAEQDATFQQDFREKFPPPLPPEELVSDLDEYLKIVEGMIYKLENYFPSDNLKVQEE
ncbi:hypothetical protein AZE42_06586 [Rhizopogon vesiculosus]|uniref:Uncharacterized protein n=1 Tax=Rhizopogon vesiculosus TaxID=180088 RepID=A0A1J8R1K4_9AGAM|nr:hypothetical protein AZE42_06586 [Rhizopogon vesiculosus]